MKVVRQAGRGTAVSLAFHSGASSAWESANGWEGGSGEGRPLRGESGRCKQRLQCK